MEQKLNSPILLSGKQFMASKLLVIFIPAEALMIIEISM